MNKLERRKFNKHNEIIELPNLLSIQVNSFKKFIKNSQKNGINKIFNNIFPIINHSKNAKLEYINYKLEKPIYDYHECKNRGITYSSSLKVKLRLIIYEENNLNNLKIKKEILQEVYMGEIPIMTKNSSFIINGIEKVIVSQLHRSPGVFFDILKEKNNIIIKKIYYARVIPYRGSWLDFEFDIKNIIFFRIDRKKKIPVTTLLYALGFNKEKIIKNFCEKITLKFFNDKLLSIDIKNNYINNKIFDFDLYDINNNIIFEKNLEIKLDNIKNNISILYINYKYIINKISYYDYYDLNNNLIIESNNIINIDILNKFKNNNIKEINIIYFNNKNYSYYILKTLNIDYNKNTNDSILDIYKILKPSEFSSLESSKNYFNLLFFSNEKYYLSPIGRMKINKSLNINNNKNNKFLNINDILKIIKKLIDLKVNNYKTDDIDSLSNRRIRTVGEMIENQFRLGLLRIEKNVKDKLSINDLENVSPKKIISYKQLTSTIKEFFNSSQLSQFMDQNNPLAEVTHKRRISALGPGGLTRERAGFEIRDIHPTHYGKLCPIETPEGPNIGLINSLSIYSRINKYGFLETPYQLVKNGKISNVIHYLSSIDEYNYVIVQANSKINEKKEFIEKYLICRNKNEFSLFKSCEINYIDVSCQQIVSIGTSLIPFLEHNDANRSLMGANMQKQAVPLIKSESPMVGTGVEKKISVDSNYTIIAKRSGYVTYLDYNCIIIKIDENKEKFKNNINNDMYNIDIYYLKKFLKSNQNTCINFYPYVNLNQYVNKGDIISDSLSTTNGELSLGKNIKVAFLSWYGYNFEDSMIISEKLVYDDIFTSIHIQEYICTIRDTKLGPEEITSDIPNVSESILNKLNEFGIINIGSYVKPGDILVGKITPKGDSQLTPEEKLLRAIFGEKASNVKDTSLRLPNSIEGIVTDIKIFIKENNEKNNKLKIFYNSKIENYKKNIYKEKKVLNSIIIYKIKIILKKYDIFLKNIKELKLLLKTKKKEININDINELKLLLNKYNDLDLDYENKINKYIKNNNIYDDLPLGVILIIKVYISSKKEIKVGDKMAGRHGNKGVISKINLLEDMPFDIYGNTIDIILNPLGVPSRMNIGQILESNIGLACKDIGNNINNLINQKNNIEKIRNYLNDIYNFNINIKNKINFNNFTDKEIFLISEKIKNGIKISTPVFNGINIEEIKYMLNISGNEESGQIFLYDGITGEKFDRKVTIGYIYIMKLNHLVDDKMHSRSTGSYSLITQQPLGGKSQFGGQRFGEMEVWALEAYGAAYTLQEMLTVKSDDVDGRINMYKNIINGINKIDIGIPESFNVLFKEIRSLCINIETKRNK